MSANVATVGTSTEKSHDSPSSSLTPLSTAAVAVGGFGSGGVGGSPRWLSGGEVLSDL